MRIPRLLPGAAVLGMAIVLAACPDRQEPAPPPATTPPPTTAPPPATAPGTTAPMPGDTLMMHDTIGAPGTTAPGTVGPGTTAPGTTTPPGTPGRP